MSIEYDTVVIDHIGLISCSAQC